MARIVELAATLQPSARMIGRAIETAPPLDRLKERPHVAGGTLSMRVEPAPPEFGLPPGTHVWALVEVWPNGHEEPLLGSHKPNEIEAMAAVLKAYQLQRAARGGR